MNVADSKIMRALRDVRGHGLVMPLLTMTLYIALLSFFFSRFLPDDARNVNAAFTSSFWKHVLIPAWGVCLVYLLYSRIRNRRGKYANYRFKPLGRGDAVFVLLPLTPIVQYVLNNQDILPAFSSYLIVGMFCVLSAVFVILIPYLFSQPDARIIHMSMGVALSFTITNMALMSSQLEWYERGVFIIQLGLFAAVFVVGLLSYRFIGARFTRTIVLVYFLSNSIVNIPTAGNRDDIIESEAQDNLMVKIVEGREPQYTPNIYLLIYDAYIADETLLQYGIDNGAQEDYLVEMGFKLYPKTYSIKATTVATMSRVFSVSRQFHGEPRTAASGDGVVQRLLQRFGYHTYGVFFGDYLFQKVGPSYDYSFPQVQEPHWLLARAILMGEFRFDFEFAKPERPDFLAEKDAVFSERGNNPRLIYVHDNLPGHSQNSGKCLPEDVPLYKWKLENANKEMRRNVDFIVQNDPDAIVIVAGDHGPYLTKNCHRTRDEYDISEISRLDIQDRYGTFLAIKWPNDNALKYDDIVILQDLFPAIFSYLFEDEEFLSAKIKPVTGSATATVSGVVVNNGRIQGGIDDGEPLFLHGTSDGAE